MVGRFSNRPATPRQMRYLDSRNPDSSCSRRLSQFMQSLKSAGGFSEFVSFRPPSRPPGQRCPLSAPGCCPCLCCSLPAAFFCHPLSCLLTRLFRVQCRGCIPRAIPEPPRRSVAVSCPGGDSPRPPRYRNRVRPGRERCCWAFLSSIPPSPLSARGFSVSLHPGSVTKGAARQKANPY